ncbi:MAG: hypothetical protein H6709_17470 [Kofleriaceae bacterium]|nr:hypothetical protein [Myxococcales bacterium]MCB9564449.1 hypothetical protein [Kofleriaceae bacterium]MCB9573873.1 hypothetical protein [Kofleriaceae bacterium]
MMKRVMILPLALGLALTACGKKGDDGPGKDWSGKALDVTVENKVNNVAFKVQLPKGMKFDGDDDGPEVITKMWKADVHDYFSEPSVMISYEAIPATDIDGFVKDAMLDDKDVIAKQEKTADGFVLVTHTKNNGIVAVEVMKVKGDAHLVCRASQAKDGGVPSPDKTMAWLEQLCSSLTIQ